MHKQGLHSLYKYISEMNVGFFFLQLILGNKICLCYTIFLGEYLHSYVQTGEDSGKNKEQIKVLIHV